MTTSPNLAPTRARITEADERRSSIGGATSMFVDSFDVYLPALVLPAAIAYFMPESLPSTTRATLTTMLFTIGLLGRPIGSVIFGHFSDRIGRKRTTMISAYGFTFVTLLMGLLPGYASWGYSAIVVFAVLRLIGGICLAGGYAAPMPLAFEQAKPHRRGWVGGIIGAGAPGSFFVINGLLFIELHTVPHDGFLTWGWRLPFFLGFLIGVAYLWHYRKVVEDDAVVAERRAATARPPIVQLVTEHRALILGVFAFTCGFWFSAQMSVSFLPTLLVEVLGRSPNLSTTLELISAAITVGAIIGFAVLGQRYGRRRVLMIAALLNAFVVAAAFLVLVLLAHHGAPNWAIGFAYVAAKVTPSAPLGVILAYLNERFPAHVRASGYSIGYMFGLILPGLYTYWLLWLAHLVPYEYAPVIPIFLGGLVMFWAVRRGPETNPVGAKASRAREFTLTGAVRA